MVQYNLRAYAFIILGLAISTYLGLMLVKESTDYFSALSLIPTTVSINLPIWFIFIQWAWKIKIFYPWLVPFPNLSGRWEGYISSNWKGKSSGKIPTEININQTFFNIQISIETDESKSKSISSSFNIDKDRGLQQLIYSYMNIPKASVREKSEIHHGTTLLEFNGFKILKMDGHYWTDRETIGEIFLEKK